jgi:hypothetical protein
MKHKQPRQFKGLSFVEGKELSSHGLMHPQCLLYREKSFHHRPVHRRW